MDLEYLSENLPQFFAICSTKQFTLVTSPAMSLRSVDFPAPFGPTRANLVSKSIPNSKFLYIQGVDSLYRKLTFWTMMTGGGMVPQL